MLAPGSRRKFLSDWSRSGLWLSMGLGNALPALSAEPAWPTKPIKLLVIAAPGGLPDIVARTLGQQLQRNLGQAVVVENRAGAGGNIATDAVAKAMPDGHTLLITGNNHAVNPVLIPNPGFDYEKDLMPVAMLAESNMVLVSSNAFAAKNIQELIALAKSKPGGVSFAISPIGTPNHLGGELLMKLADIDLNIIPYKGIGAAMPDLLSGQVDLAISSLPAVLPLIKAGKLKAISVSRSFRSPLAPEIPTSAEMGLRGFEVNAWICLMSTGGTPDFIVQRLSKEVRIAFATPSVQQQLLQQGIEPMVSTPEELSTFIRAESQKWTAVLKTAKLKN